MCGWVVSSDVFKLTDEVFKIKYVGWVGSKFY